MIKHYLNFISPLNLGLIEMEEPIGFDATPFYLGQEENRMGRDVSYAGSGEAKFTIHKRFHHTVFDLVQQCWEMKGFEANVQYVVEMFGVQITQGNIDFGKDFSTDNYETINYTVIEESTKAGFKRNYDFNTDLRSYTDINGNPITPPTLHKVLANALPVTRRSSWKIAQFQLQYEQPTNYNEFAFFTNGVYFNPMQVQDATDILSTLSGGLVNFNTGSPDSFRYLQASQTIENLLIRFNLNVLYKYRPNEFTSAGDKAGSLSLVVRYGQTWETANEIIVWYNGSSAESDADFQLPSTLEAVVPFLNETDIVWVYFRVGSQNAAVNRIQFSSTDNFEAIAIQVPDSTVVNCVRLYDAMKYAVKSASGLDIYAPKFAEGGKYYDMFLTTSALMRYKFDKPFNLSVKQVFEDILPFANGDYQLMTDNTVYIGTERQDFYRNVEVATLLHPERAGYNISEMELVLDEYSQELNPRAYLKKAALKFSKYASLKEIPQEGTEGILHGETEKKLPNENADSTLEVTIGVPFDPYYFDEERVKGMALTKDTATQDNDTIFPIDAIPLPVEEHRGYVVTKFLRHEPNLPYPNGTILTLVNDGSFSFLQLGIGINTPVDIFNTDNGGLYNVIAVEDQRLLLTPINTDAPQFREGENTRFKYYIDPNVILQNRGNQGFSNISGIDNADRFGNLAYTADRLIQTAYSENIKTACIYHPNELVRGTLYKNNKDATTTYNGLTVVEGGNFVGYDGVNHPILAPTITQLTAIMPYSEWEQLKVDVQEQFGYIRYIQPNGYPVMGYPKELTATAITKNPANGAEYLMKVTGTMEDKFLPYYLNIFYDGEVIMINNEIRPDGLRFVIDKGKLSIFDRSGELLYPPFPYYRVQINNGTAFSSETELAIALQSIN